MRYLASIASLLILLSVLLSCTDDPNKVDAPQQIAFLWFDSAEMQQLYLIDSSGANPTKVSSSDQSVLDFTPSPNGEQIIYSQQFSATSTVLMLADTADPTPTTIITCQRATCQNPIWSNDNRRVIYERRDEVGQQPRLYWLDTVTGQTAPVFSTDVTAYNAQLSADDAHLAFVYVPQEDENDENEKEDDEQSTPQRGHIVPEIAIFTFATGDQLQISNRMNTPVEWHPTASRFLFSDMEFYGEKFGIHLFSMDVNDVGEETQSAPVDLSQALVVEDIAANWSPDGERITFGRKQASVNMGAQLWIMDADGTNGTQLTFDHDIHHGAPQWSADGRAILHQRFNLTETWATPSLWLYDIETATSTQIAPNGSQPRYIP